MLVLTEFAINHIRATIRAGQLMGNERRRVEPLGNIFVSAMRTDGWFLFSLKIDGVDYYFYRE